MTLARVRGPYKVLNPAETHIRSLDGVRGLAVLLVLIYHSTFVNVAGHGVLTEMLGRLTSSAWIGVNIFFGLSGFLITSILLKTVGDEGFLRKFYIRRVLRIFPLYYAVLVLLLCLTPLLKIHWHGSAPYYLLYLQNYVPYERLSLSVGTISLHLEHFWSLAVEEQFYLVWPFLVLAFGARKRFIFVPLTLLLLCPVARSLAISTGAKPISTYTWTPYRVDDLAWGALAAMIVRFWANQTLVASRILGAVGLLGIIVFFVVRGPLLPGDPAMQRFGFSMIGATVSAVLLSLAAQEAKLTAFFSSNLLRWFGKYSYGIYVFHYMFADTYAPIRRFVTEETGSKGLGVAALVATTFIVGTGLAWLSYNLFEQQFLKLKEPLARYAMTKRIRIA